MITLKPIGLIRTSFTVPVGTPIQPVFAEGAQGTVEVFPEYADGLRDLAGFERVWLLYSPSPELGQGFGGVPQRCPVACRGELHWFDRAGPSHLRVISFRDTEEAKSVPSDLSVAW